MKRRSILLALVLGLVTSACATRAAEESHLATLESGAEESGQTGDGTEANPVDAEAALMAFSQCMRDNGFPDYPDPTLNADGTVGFGLGRGALEEAGIDPRSEEFRTAREACADNLEGIALGPGGEGFDPTEMADTLLAFAQCMRDHGIPMDDPDPSGFGPGRGGEPGAGGPFGDVDFTDPDVQAAFQACQKQVNMSGPGGGGFPGGGPGGGQPPSGGEPPDGRSPPAEGGGA